MGSYIYICIHTCKQVEPRVAGSFLLSPQIPKLQCAMYGVKHLLSKVTSGLTHMKLLNFNMAGALFENTIFRASSLIGSGLYCI